MKKFVRKAGTWIGQDHQRRKEKQPLRSHVDGHAATRNAAPRQKLGAEKFSSKGERKCSIVQPDV